MVLRWLRIPHGIAPDAEGYENDGSVIGVSAGFIADIGLADDSSSINTGINYDYLNGKLKLPYATSDGSGTMSRKYNLRYVELPLTIKMRTNSLEILPIPANWESARLLMSEPKSQDEFTLDDGTVLSDDNNDVSKEIALVKESLIIGAGAEYFIDESTSLFVQFTFNAGLTNILTGNNSLNTDISQMGKLYALQLLV